MHFESAAGKRDFRHGQSKSEQQLPRIDVTGFSQRSCDDRYLAPTAVSRAGAVRVDRRNLLLGKGLWNGSVGRNQSGRPWAANNWLDHARDGGPSGRNYMQVNRFLQSPGPLIRETLPRKTVQKGRIKAGHNLAWCPTTIARYGSTMERTSPRRHGEHGA